MASNTQDFGANNNPQTSNPSATGATGSTGSNDPVVASYGNTHSSTNRTNPIHPSDPQSTAHPAYGNSTFSSPYETSGGNTTQGDGEGAGVGQGAGVGGVGSRGGLAMGEDYHANVDAAYGHATRASPPEGYKPLGENEGKRGPYDTAGGNAAQAGEGGGSTHAGGQTFEPTTAREAVPDTGYRAQPYTSGNMRAGGNSTGTEQTRSTGSKVKEMAHGVKGLFAAVHGAGEKARGDFNAGVDRTFNEVCDPYPVPFPSLRQLGEFAEDGDGEFPESVYAPTSSRADFFAPRWSGDEEGTKGCISS
jgi:hypothetical protein